MSFITPRIGPLICCAWLAVVPFASYGEAQEIFSDDFESGDASAWSSRVGLIFPCDDGIGVGDSDAANGAAAMEICELSVAGSAGLVSAAYTTVDGADQLSELTDGLLGVGVLDGFGTSVDVRKGQRMLALSSGTARDPGDPGYQSPSGFDKSYQSSYPTGFPYGIADCPGTLQDEPHDSAAINLTLIPPSGVSGFAFDIRFFTYDFSGLVCSDFMDQLVVLMDPAPVGAAPGMNIAVDSEDRPITMLSCEACTAGNYGGLEFSCPLGTGDLDGTGFEGRGASGWITVEAPVTPGVEFDLVIGVWDSGDGSFDSTALVDNFRWTN